MATFTATANSSSTIGYAQYGSTTWNKGTTNGACQGAYLGLPVPEKLKVILEQLHDREAPGDSTDNNTNDGQ